MPEQTADCSETIEHDYPCIGCEYILYGLPRDGRCPECGLAVEETIRPFTGDVRIPLRLRIVGVMLIIGGSLSLIVFLPELATRTLRVPIEALALPVGFGLLRLSNRWRMLGIVLLLPTLVFTIIGLVLSFISPGPSTLTLFKIPIAIVSTVPFLSGISLFTLVMAWMIHVLIDRRIRMMCRVIGSRMRWLRPGVHQQYRRIMGLIAAGSISAGAIVAGGMIVFAETLDAWLVERARRIEAASEDHTAEPGPAQLTITFDWNSDGHSIGGAHFTSRVRRLPSGATWSWGAVAQSSGFQQVGPTTYSKAVVSGRDKPVEDVPSRALVLLYHRDPRTMVFDIRLTCRVPSKIAFGPEYHAYVIDMKTNTPLRPPYVLPPGEHHLQAAPAGRGNMR